MNQMAMGMVVKRGYRGYFHLGTDIQEGDWIRVLDGRTATVTNYRVLGEAADMTAPNQSFVVVDLEWDAAAVYISGS
jgi:hypothetical protein